MVSRRGPVLVPRGVAVWVEADGTDEAALAHAAQLVLARVQRIAPEAEVHLWPASGAAQPAPAPGAATDEPGIEDSAAGVPTRPGPRRVAVDLATESVLVDERPVPLTGVEFRLLRYLVENCSRPINRWELQRFLESLDFPGCAPRSIDVYVARVRRKLGGARSTIATIRGGGYQFIPGPCATVRGPADYSI